MGVCAAQGVHAGSSMSHGSTSSVHPEGSTTGRGAGSVLNHNGFILMAAARGQHSLLSAWADFRHDPGVKLCLRSYKNAGQTE